MTQYFQQLEHSLNSLRAHYRARKEATAAVRTMLAVADAQAATCAQNVAKIRADARQGVEIGVAEIIEAHRASGIAHAEADGLRAKLDHVHAAEVEALENMQRAADNLFREVEAMVLMESTKPEIDDIGPVWDSLNA